MKPSWVRSVSIACWIVALSAGAARASFDPWAPGVSWVSLRGGYSNSSVDGDGKGGPGFGFGFNRMMMPVKFLGKSLFKHYSLGGNIEYNVSGKFGSAAQIVVPATLELQRHFGESSTLRSYLGIGLGAYYRKLYRTGADTRETHPGISFDAGANTVVSQRGLLGFDFKLSSVRSVNDPSNPVFGVGSGDVVPDPNDPTKTIIEPKNGLLWGVKVTYSVAY